MNYRAIAEKIEAIVAKRRWRRLIYITGFLLIVGFAADHTPWARGWFHELRWGIRVSPYADWEGLFTGKTSFKRFTDSWQPLSANTGLNSMPDKLLQHYAKNYRETVDKWHEENVNRYPWLQINFREIADEDNGYFAIHKWQEEDRIGSANNSFREYDVPERFISLYEIKLVSSNSKQDLMPEITGELVGDLGVYLESKKALLSRAMSIGHMPDRSMNEINLFEAGFIPVAWVKDVVDHLKLKAFYEAYQGDEEAALKTLTVLRGWGSHYQNLEATSLIGSTLGRALQIMSASYAYWVVLPLLPEATIHKPEWETLFESDWNYSKQIPKIYGGEWYLVVNYLIPSAVTGYNFRDLPAFLDWYADRFNSLVITDPTLGAIRQPTNHLTVATQSMTAVIDIGAEAYTAGLLKSFAVMHQYEVAFKLRKLEAAGKDLNALNQKTLDALPLQILPNLRLKIDFEKRLILDPAGKIKSFEPLAF